MLTRTNFRALTSWSQDFHETNTIFRVVIYGVRFSGFDISDISTDLISYNITFLLALRIIILHKYSETWKLVRLLLNEGKKNIFVPKLDAAGTGTASTRRHFTNEFLQLLKIQRQEWQKYQKTKCRFTIKYMLYLCQSAWLYVQTIYISVVFKQKIFL